MSSYFSIILSSLYILSLAYDNNNYFLSPSNNPGTSPDANNEFMYSKNVVSKAFYSSKINTIFSYLTPEHIIKSLNKSSKSANVNLFDVLISTTL